MTKQYYGDTARGVSPEQRRLAGCPPALEPAFFDQARTALQPEALLLGGQPGAQLRILAGAYLNQGLGGAMRDAGAGKVRAWLRNRIGLLLNLPRGDVNAVLSPAGFWEVPDDLAAPRPLPGLVVHESAAIPADLCQPPAGTRASSRTWSQAQSLRTRVIQASLQAHLPVGGLASKWHRLASDVARPRAQALSVC